LAHRVHDTSRKLADFVFLDLQARVLKTLQQLATLNKELQPPRMVVDDFLSRKDLAALVGASREAVSRALHGLQDSGHLEVSSSRVILFDLQS